MGETGPEPSIRVQPATPDRWLDLVSVMGTRGDPSRCWCQFHRLRGQAWRRSSAAENKAALCEQVVSGAVPPGVIAYRDGDPAGWCAIGPKRESPRLLASPTAGEAVEGIWSLTCFVVRTGHRRQGVARELLSGAIDLARSQGAEAVEAYPVDLAKRRATSAAELYRGPLSLFLGAGFSEVGRPSAARAIVRLEL